MRQRVCEHLNMFLWGVLNSTQYETKGLWEAKHVLLRRVKFNTAWDNRVCEQLNMFFWGVLNWTQYETKGLWSAKHVLLKSLKFNTVWERGFLTRKTCSFEECYI